MADWRSIPGNEYAFERLRDLLGKGDAIAFVGAGASAGLYPLWDGLLEALITKAEKAGKADAATAAAWRADARNDPDAAAHDIRRALGEGSYRNAMREIFKPRTGHDGRRFTVTHGHLLRLPFRGFITTNYDPCLIEARASIRPDCPTTGFATWMDGDAVEAWRGGEVFDEHPCPILFAHGIYERSNTVVLGTTEYREVYSDGAFHRLFKQAWGAEHLVFVGFGFTDPWVKMMANDVLPKTSERTREPRHVAVLGLPPDDVYTDYTRRRYADKFDADILFYPVVNTDDGGENHSALGAILGELTAHVAPPPPSEPAPEPPKPALDLARQCWNHETTNDPKFTGRKDALGKLDRWAHDPSVRSIAITGVGGLGKTSLIGHWLKDRDGTTTRDFVGLFYWSFYSGRDIGEFLAALIAFGVNVLGASEPDEGIRRTRAAGKIARDHPILIVLDGLEVLQELPSTANYGAITDGELREFLVGVCGNKEIRALLILTSRFPFPDLRQFVGFGHRGLDLDLLSPEEGADLLTTLDVDLDRSGRLEAARKLEGHPLALRIFALASKTSFTLDTLDENEELEAKLRRVLTFYEQHLPPERTALLGLVSFFRAPVATGTLVTLARELPKVSDALGRCDDHAVEWELGRMAMEHLLIRDIDGGSALWSCHPILRDHFRATLLGWDEKLATKSAGLIAGAPSDERPTNIVQLQPVLDAIDLLLTAGAYHSANDLYRNRLDNGQIFLDLTAPAVGMACTLGFVGDADRRNRCETELGKRRVSYFLNGVGINARNAGDLSAATVYLRAGNSIHRAMNEKRNLSISLQNLSDVLRDNGMLAVAHITAEEALHLARATEMTPDDETRDSLAHLANVADCLGRVGSALAAFAAADKIKRHHYPTSDGLNSISGLQWASLLYRVGDVERATNLIQDNSVMCEYYGRLDVSAVCYTFLGRISAEMGAHGDADRHLSAAENTFRGSGMLSELMNTLLTRADLERRRKEWDAGFVAVEEALALAGPRDFRLIQADGLVLRGRIRLDRDGGAAAERAYDDAEAASRIAQSCEYAWAERNAWALLAETRALTGDAKGADHAEKEAALLTARLSDITPPAPDPFAWVYKALNKAATVWPRPE